MKKITAVLLTVLILASFSAVYADNSIELPDISLSYDDDIKGDINKDGSVDNKDIASLFRLVSAKAETAYTPAYDVNSDSKVNNKDVTVLFRNVSKL